MFLSCKGVNANAALSVHSCEARKCAHLLDVLRACVQASKLREAVTRFADDLSCAVFGMANSVTIMFHVLQWTTR